jgi:alkylated DNA repair dioxygenase AlkB
MPLICLPDAELQFDPQYFASRQADELLRALIDSTPWETHSVRIFGKEIPAPRLSSWHGDAGTAYQYSGKRYLPKAWTSALNEIRDRLGAQNYNSVLANFYRAGSDSMGWHSDNEPELGPAPVIASLSFGAARRFCLRHKSLPLKHEILLTHGSLLIMRGSTQSHWQHALPKSAKIGQPRVNLTFRRIV